MAARFDPGFANTGTDHCRECVPYDVPKGTTVVCSHRDHHHHHDDHKAARHVVISAGGPDPGRPDLPVHPEGAPPEITHEGINDAVAELEVAP
jgi:hypothetical protein